MVSSETLDIDFSNEAMEPAPLSDAYQPPVLTPSSPVEAWRARRSLTWGSSEVATLLLAYELAPMDAKVAAWMREGATFYQRLGIPKLLAWKAGLRAEPGRDQAIKDKGNELERRVLTRWQFTDAHKHVDPRTIQHASQIPRNFLPLPDRRCPAIAVSPDAWAFGHGPRSSRDFVDVEVKTTRDEVTEVPWGYVQQTRTQMDAMAADRGVVVMGVCWLRDDLPEDHESKRLAVFTVARDERETRVRYAVATEALALTDRLAELALEVSTDGMDEKELRRTRATRKAAAKRCRDLWAESKARVEHLRDLRLAQLEAVLDGIEGLDWILARQSA